MPKVRPSLTYSQFVDLVESGQSPQNGSRSRLATKSPAKWKKDQGLQELRPLLIRISIKLLQFNKVEITAKPKDDFPWYITWLVSWLPDELVLGGTSGSSSCARCSPAVGQRHASARAGSAS